MFIQFLKSLTPIFHKCHAYSRAAIPLYISTFVCWKHVYLAVVGYGVSFRIGMFCVDKAYKLIISR